MLDGHKVYSVLSYRFTYRVFSCLRKPSVIKFLLIVSVQGLYDGRLMFDSLIGGCCFGQCRSVDIVLKTVEDNTCQDTRLIVVIANQARWVS